MLSREPDPRLQPLVIWVPKVRGRETHIGRASESVPDARVQHFWDGSALLMNAYQDVLGLPEDAWDMFLVYPPGVRWEGDLPPAPQFWMHQLGPREKPRVSGPYLDPPRLARVLDATLDGRDEADPDETDGDARPRD